MSEQDWGNKLQQAQDHVSSKSFSSGNTEKSPAGSRRSEIPPARLMKQLGGSKPGMPAGAPTQRPGSLPTTNTKSNNVVDPNVMYAMNQTMMSEIIRRLRQRIRG